MRRILVTGSSGHLGEALVRALVAQLIGSKEYPGSTYHRGRFGETVTIRRR